jgi:hypothetical protein
MGDSSVVSYVFVVPESTKAITISGHGRHDLAGLSSTLPFINGATVKIRKMVRDRG